MKSILFNMLLTKTKFVAKKKDSVETFFIHTLFSNLNDLAASPSPETNIPTDEEERQQALFGGRMNFSVGDQKAHSQNSQYNWANNMWDELSDTRNYKS